MTNVFSYNGKIYVRVSKGNFDNSNTCTQSTTGLFLWLDPTNDFDKAQLAIALSAKVSGKLVWAAGNNQCVNGPSGSAERMVGMDLKGQ